MRTILIIFSFLSLLSHSSYSISLLDDDAAAINVTASNSSLSRSAEDDSFAGMIDRALEKEFQENDEQSEG